MVTVNIQLDRRFKMTKLRKINIMVKKNQYNGLSDKLGNIVIIVT